MTLLLERGADPEQPIGAHREDYPLRFVAARDRVSIAAALIRAGARVNGEPWPQHSRPIVLAVAYASPEMVNLLLDSGVDVNGTEPYANRPLRAAVDSRRLSMIRLLVQRGGQPHAHDVATVVQQMNDDDGADDRRRSEYAETIELMKKAQGHL